MTDATPIYAIAAWAGIAFLFFAGVMDKNRLFKQVAITGALLMTYHHTCMATNIRNEMNRPHRAPNIWKETGA